jgi:hypothetical protein
MYITFYKYLCEGAKELYAFWKTIYEYIPIKDLKCDSFAQSINELILEVFVAGTTQFRPKNMLPVMSLANKCKFVNVDKECSNRRMELTKFKEDELAVNLARASAHKLKQMGYNPEEYLGVANMHSEMRKNPFRMKDSRDSRMPTRAKMGMTIFIQTAVLLKRSVLSTSTLTS